MFIVLVGWIDPLFVCPWNHIKVYFRFDFLECGGDNEK
jgi:hypothetical protein